MPHSFKEFFETKRRAAASAFVAGNGQAVVDISASSGPATFFDPGGGFTEGADAINAANLEGAKAFGSDGQTQLQVTDLAESGDIAYWTGYQVAQVVMAGKQIDMRIRVTEVFRLMEGDWKMVHRHASMAK